MKQIAPISYPAQLPISSCKEEIIQAIRDQQVIIVAGDTGSGKSTQLPKMCLEAGRGRKKMIGCTQPRRIAATSVAARVAEELGACGRETVGYRIRFADRTSRRTRIKFMTDGILLAETQRSRNLNAYDTLIIDEAHERSLNIDFLLGYLKQLIHVRQDLKLLITSATIDTEKFSRHFERAPVITISGRTFPVTVRYSPLSKEDEDEEDENYISGAVQAAVAIHHRGKPGDILIFMPTEKDIRETVDSLHTAFSRHGQVKPPTILPLFGRLRSADQGRVFRLFRNRKIVVATNVAETSITVPGIRYVIDTGLARISSYNARARTTSLPVAKISRASCDQRQGRCGRVGPGICIRLYSEEDYLQRPEYTLPEIKRANLAEVILRMISLHLGDLATFPFIDPPRPRSISDGYQLLTELQAITRVDSKWQLTNHGKVMARLPVDPSLARIIVEARHHHAVREVLIIAAALTIADPRIRPADKEAEADKAHNRFAVESSDFLSYLAIWDAYHHTLRQVKSQSRIRRFCRTHFLSYQKMREWLDIHDQLLTVLREDGTFPVNQRQAGYEAIHKAILSGFLRNIGMKKAKNIYQGGNSKELMIFPGSAQFHKAGPWIVAAELVETTRLYARTVADIKVEWLEPIAGLLCKSSYSNPRWEKKRGQVVADEKVTLFGLVIVAGRKVNYSKLNTAARQEAREIFIHRALIEGDLRGRYNFLEHNLNLIKKLADWEDRFRQRNVLADEYTLYSFYDQRLDEVHDQAGLNRLLKKKGAADRLKMSEKDILVKAPARHLETEFPENLQIGDFTCPLSYSFKPGSEDDGVTIDIPVHLCAHLNPAVFEWLVPGLLPDKVAALLRGLPKTIRRHLVPIPETTSHLLGDLVPSQDDFYLQLSRSVHRRYGIMIERRQWPTESLPAHLRMRYRLVDTADHEIIASRNFDELKACRPETLGHPDLEDLKKKWEREGIEQWDFDDLPDKIPIQGNVSLQGYAYPALVLGKDSHTDRPELAVRLYMNKEESRRQTRQGLQALYSKQFARQIRLLRQECENFAKRRGRDFSMLTGLQGDSRVTGQDLLFFLLEEVFHTGEGILHGREQFAATVRKVQQQGLHVLTREMLVVLQEVMNERQVVLDQLRRFESSRRSPQGGQQREFPFRKELDNLLPKDFLQKFSYAKLRKTLRYVKALGIRIERAHADPAKDGKKMEQLAPLLKRYHDLQLPTDPSPECRRCHDEYVEMLEEFKISLFAQEMKTLFPVSIKRLDKKWQELRICC
jgi:ATP-dependent helicase HrpA